MVWFKFLINLFILDAGIFVAGLNGDEKSFIAKTILKDYSPLFVPIGEDKKAVNVSIDLFLTDLEPMLNVAMGYSFAMFLRMKWFDYRLVHSHIQTGILNKSIAESITMPAEFVDLIWRPDIYLVQGRQVSLQTITKPNKFVILYPDGRVYFSQHLTINLAFCNMDLHRFPFDQQKCSFEMESYAYNNRYLSLEWFKNPDAPDKSPIVIKTKSTAYHHFVKKIDWGKKEKAHPPFGGTFDRLQINFYFERMVSFFIWQMYIPLILIVILSWVSFWIDYRSIPARVGLGITTVLTMATLGNSTRGSLPKVDYSKSLDWYILICFIYVFCAFLEFAFVGIMDLKWKHMNMKHEEKNGQKKKTEGRTIQRCHSNQSNGSSSSSLRRNQTPMVAPIDDASRTELEFVYEKAVRQRSNINRIKNGINVERLIIDKQQKYSEIHVIDKFSRYLFPISFFLFNVGYFSYYLNSYEES